MLKDIKSYFQKSIEDLQLTTSERKAINAVLKDANLQTNQLGDLRSSIFKIAKAELTHLQPVQVVEWLEEANKLLFNQKAAPSGGEVQVFFSPGEDCRNAIANSIKAAQQHINICVFTISDDMLAREIIKKHQQGVKVRIITDNDKTYDKGSDIFKMKEAGVSIRTDDTPNHMHHKFATIDAETLINGSYNWTRSAYAYNNENVVVSSNAAKIDEFDAEFERLWGSFWDY